jgi:hypothetical protein
MASPQNQAAQAQNFRRLVASQAIKEQKTVLPVPYWSTVRIQGTVAANVLTVAPGPRKAFAYQIGQDMTVAGFTAAATTADSPETNLLQASTTLDNADVWIWGLAIELCPNSEPILAARLFRDCVVELSTSGTQSIRLGTLGMFPSAGGLYGTGRSFAAVPSFAETGAGDGGTGAPVGFVANGNPMGGNFMRFPQPFKWSSVGSNQGDSQLVVNIEPKRAITIPLNVTRAAAAGVAAYTQPTTGQLGTFCDFRLRLVAVSVSNRSQNV